MARKKTRSVRWWLKRRIVVDRPGGYEIAYVLTEADLEQLGVLAKGSRL